MSGFCPRHRMAKTARGCPGCLQEETAVHAAERRRFVTWAAAVGVPFALLAVWMLMRPSPPDDKRLDPGLYRTDIEIVEATLYAGDHDSQTQIDAAMHRLAATLGGNRPTLAEKQAALAIGMLASEVGSDYAMKTRDVAAVRQRWEGLRQTHFRPADWFQSATAELEAQDTEAAMVGHAKDNHRWENTITGLDLAVSHVRGALTGWPEGDFSGSDLQRLEDARVALKNEIEHVRTNQPDVILRPEPVWSQARRALEKAISQTEKLLAPSRTASGVPNSHELETRLFLAESAIRMAGEALEKASAESP